MTRTPVDARGVIRASRQLPPTTRPTRATRSPRPARNSQDANSSGDDDPLVPAVIRIMAKTLSSEAAAGTVPAAPGLDPESRERARSEQMRSMFSVLVYSFELPPGDRVAGPTVGKKQVRECSSVFRLHARGRNGPGTRPRDPPEASGGAVGGPREARGHGRSARPIPRGGKRVKVVQHHLYVGRVDDVLRPLLRPILVIF